MFTNNAFQENKNSLSLPCIFSAILLELLICMKYIDYI
jgi:hypothetical protein